MRRFIAEQLQADAWIILSEDHGLTLAIEPATPAFMVDAHFIKGSQQSGQIIYSQALAGSGYASIYLPLQTAMRNRGVLAVALAENSPELSPARRELLAAISSLTAVAVERLHYVDVAQSTQLNMISERLRSSILSALSHDLRTPLTVLVGLADSLSLVKPLLPAPALETAQAVRDQAARIANLVSNLLDMARLNAGNIALRREWQPLDEVIGASIKLLGTALHEHPVSVQLPADLPLLEFDAVLMERVFCNLLENSAKYAPANTPIDITAQIDADHVTVALCDRGPGFAPEQQQEIFTMFGRGRSESSEMGVGLGLAICRAIVEAHGGIINAGNHAGGGCIKFTLPRGEPPVLEAEEP